MPTYHKKYQPHPLGSQALEFFTDAEGQAYDYGAVGRQIDLHHPALKGEHVEAQLKALGLQDAAQGGYSPYMFPFSFTDCEKDAWGLTEEEEEHLRESGVTGMKSFRFNRSEHLRMKARNPSPTAPEPCWTCRVIAQKLGLK
jgi:hypothetical protein